MSRTISIEDLNKRIDELIKEYENSAEECTQELGDEERSMFYTGKVEALVDLKMELNSPDAVVNVTENVQQTLNVIEANKIINDNPDKDEL